MDGTIRISKDGPYIVSGTITLQDQKGGVYTVSGKAIRLCRCGDSAAKPFCDNAHVRTGFESAPEARTVLSIDHAQVADASGPQAASDVSNPTRWVTGTDPSPANGDAKSS